MSSLLVLALLALSRSGEAQVRHVESLAGISDLHLVLADFPRDSPSFSSLESKFRADLESQLRGEGFTLHGSATVSNAKWPVLVVGVRRHPGTPGQSTLVVIDVALVQRAVLDPSGQSLLAGTWSLSEFVAVADAVEARIALANSVGEFLSDWRSVNVPTEGKRGRVGGRQP